MKIKVRIALAVDHKGHWSACGWNEADSETIMSSCLDSLEANERRYWVDVEVDAPEGDAEVVNATAIPDAADRIDK